MHGIEVQIPLQGPISPDVKINLYEKVKVANRLIEKVKRLENGQAGKWKQDLDREIGRLARLTNAISRTQHAASETSSEDGGEKEGFMASWADDYYEIQLHTDVLQERDEKISNIGTAIDQVNGLYKDIATMVNQQGETLDRIEDFIGNTVGNSKKAAEELSKAEQRAVSNRKNQCCLVILVVLALLLISLTMTVYWEHKKHSSVPPPS